MASYPSRLGANQPGDTDGECRSGETRCIEKDALCGSMDGASQKHWTQQVAISPEKLGLVKGPRSRYEFFRAKAGLGILYLCLVIPSTIMLVGICLVAVDFSPLDWKPVNSFVTFVS